MFKKIPTTDYIRTEKNKVFVNTQLKLTIMAFTNA